MSLTVEAKQAVVTEVAAVAKTAQSAVAAEYRGLTVAEMTKLRMAARQAGVYVRVVKNTLARRAIEGTSFECMKGSLKGPLVLAFSREDPGRGRSSRQGLREGARQARDRRVVDRRRALSCVRHRSFGFVADARPTLARCSCRGAERAADAARADAGRARRDVGPNAQGPQRASAAIGCFIGFSCFQVSQFRGDLSCRCRMQS